MNEQWTPTLCLSANEHMQIYLTGHRLNSQNKKEFKFSITVDCTVTIDDQYARKFPLNLIVGFAKNGSGISVQMDMINLPNVSPTDFKNIIDHLQSSPAFAKLMIGLFNTIIHNRSEQEKTEATQLKKMFIERFPQGITNYTSSMQAKHLYWLYSKDHLVWNVSPFAIDERGGHVAFTVAAGFRNGFFIQGYEIECMMHIFNEDDTLGYYFEFYLDEDDFHHQRLYDELPDCFMRNKNFLNRILQLMKQCDADGYDDYLQDLIIKFKASI